MIAIEDRHAHAHAIYGPELLLSTPPPLTSSLLSEIRPHFSLLFTLCIFEVDGKDAT